MDIITIILVAMYANCWLVGCFVGESTPKKSYKHIVSATSISALLNITFLIVSWSGEVAVSPPDAGFLT